MRWSPSGLMVMSGLAVASCLALAGRADANSYVKVADEWGTIQSAGPRGAFNGNRFWNIEGDATGFASSGTLRFDMEDLVTQLNADFPDGWQINNITLVTEHADAAFSTTGAMSIFHFTNDDLAITNGMDMDITDLPPGNFSSLGGSSLVYSDSATSGGEPVRVQDAGGSEADFGTVTRVNDYTFSPQGSSNLDVFGTATSLVDPVGAKNLAPDYDLEFPTVNPDDSLTTFATEIAADNGEWADGALATLIADLSDGTDPLSFIFTSTDAASTVAATYKGNPFDPEYPPRIYIDASAAGGGECTLTGDFNCSGAVENADLTLLLNNWAAEVPPTPEGWTGIPQPTAPAIDNDELTALLNNWGASLPGNGGSQVPEPGCVVLILFGLVGLVLERRRTSR
jgi:hypothetical protein